jgi:hypothetical protein
MERDEFFSALLTGFFIRRTLAICFSPYARIAAPCLKFNARVLSAKRVPKTKQLNVKNRFVSSGDVGVFGQISVEASRRWEEVKFQNISAKR